MRYADECNIYVGSERSGHRVMTSVVQFIESRLRLKVNTTKSAVAKPEERHFLGFRLRKREDGDVEVLLSKRSVERIDEKIRELTARNWGQGIDACIKHVNRYLIGWICFFGIVSDGVARKFGNIDAHIRRRLRALQLRQWGRRRHIVHHLQRLCSKGSTAWRQVYKGRASMWKLSHTAPVERAPPNKWFTARGLVSVLKTWVSRVQASFAKTARLDLTFS